MNSWFCPAERPIFYAPARDPRTKTTRTRIVVCSSRSRPYHTSITRPTRSAHREAMKNSRRGLLFAFSAANASLAVALIMSQSQKNAQCLIKICHHKDCVKRGGGETLLNTFRDLLPGGSNSAAPSVTIESSGCLSQCGKGPNVFALGSDGKEKLYFGVEDPTTASAVLDVATGQEYPINLLVAATSILEAEHGQ